MKKILSFILLVLALNAKAQERPQERPKPGDGKYGNGQTLFSGNEGKFFDQVDTTKLTRKTVSQEISIPKALDILVDMSCDLIIKTWTENKVKIETSVQFEGASEISDEQWLNAVGISVKQFGDVVRAKCHTGGFYNAQRGSGLNNWVYVYRGNGFPYGHAKGERLVTLYVPSQSALEIENKFGHLTLTDNIKNVSVTNTHGNIDATNIERLQLRSNSGSFTAGTVNDGDLGFTHGRISLKELSKGVLTGSYNTIEIEKVGDLKLNSNSDDIDIANAKSLSGIKNYGSLLVNTSGEINLEGINSNIKLRNILPSTASIRIVNRNADLRLPVNDLKNYAIEIKGNFNTLYSSFAESMHVDTLTTNEINSIRSKYDAILEASRKISTGTIGITLTAGGGVTGFAPMQSFTTGTTTSYFAAQNNLKYTIKAGDGSQPKFEITCMNCTLDFK